MCKKCYKSIEKHINYSQSLHCKQSKIKSKFILDKDKNKLKKKIDTEDLKLKIKNLYNLKKQELEKFQKNLNEKVFHREEFNENSLEKDFFDNYHEEIQCINFNFSIYGLTWNNNLCHFDSFIRSIQLFNFNLENKQLNDILNEEIFNLNNFKFENYNFSEITIFLSKLINKNESNKNMMNKLKNFRTNFVKYCMGNDFGRFASCTQWFRKFSNEKIMIKYDNDEIICTNCNYLPISCISLSKPIDTLDLEKLIFNFFFEKSINKFHCKDCKFLKENIKVNVKFSLPEILIISMDFKNDFYDEEIIIYKDKNKTESLKYYLKVIIHHNGSHFVTINKKNNDYFFYDDLNPMINEITSFRLLEYYPNILIYSLSN